MCSPYTAVKQGSYTRHFHSPQYPQDDGPGLFATLTNPYAFARAQVRHVLLWAWERRHCAHMTDFPGYLGAVIRVK